MYPADGGTNLPTSGQLQEAAIALATTAGKYTAVSEELVAIATTALAAGQDVTSHWRGKAPASFLTSLDKLAGDVSNIAGALAASATAMLSLAQVIGSQSGAIATANQLTAHEPAHPSSAQAQQLSNALLAANAAMGAITSAANAAAGQLDEVEGVGTCSTGEIPDSATLKQLSAELQALQAGGRGSKPPGGRPPTTGGEPSGGGPEWLSRFAQFFKKNWLAGIIVGTFNTSPYATTDLIHGKDPFTDSKFWAVYVSNVAQGFLAGPILNKAGVITAKVPWLDANSKAQQVMIQSMIGSGIMGNGIVLTPWGISQIYNAINGASSKSAPITPKGSEQVTVIPLNSGPHKGDFQISYKGQIYYVPQTQLHFEEWARQHGLVLTTPTSTPPGTSPSPTPIVPHPSQG
jgi:hypothetical protein